MKYFFIGAIVLLLAAAGAYLVLQSSTGSPVPVTTDTTPDDLDVDTPEPEQNSVTVRDDVYGYAFTYPEGYLRIEDAVEGEDVVHGFSIYDEAQYEEFTASTEPREGPPAIQVRLYENTQMLDPGVWVDENPQESNVTLGLSAPQEAVVGGANAVQYIVDGLYPTETYVVAHGEYVFMISGSYLDPADEIHQVFTDIVDSFSFIPTE